MGKTSYRSMFKVTPASTYITKDDLEKLAQSMTGDDQFHLGDEKVNESTLKRGINWLVGVFAPPEEKHISTIPAGYTYLGQFITHDISHDSKTDRKEKLIWSSFSEHENLSFSSIFILQPIGLGC